MKEYLHEGCSPGRYAGKCQMSMQYIAGSVRPCKGRFGTLHIARKCKSGAQTHVLRAKIVGKVPL